MKNGNKVIMVVVVIVIIIMYILLDKGILNNESSRVDKCHNCGCGDILDMMDYLTTATKY